MQPSVNPILIRNPGEKLEGTYELIEVTKDEVIFRNKEKLYRIENRVGNNL